MDDEPTSRRNLASRRGSSPVAGRQPSLPRLVLIADGFASGRRRVAERALEATHAGVPWVHLRDRAAAEGAFLEAARVLAGQLRVAAPRVLVSVNSRLGVAAALGAGLHTGQRGPSVQAARGALRSHASADPDVPVGFSAHSMEEARARAAGADYLFFSPVFPTGSKPGHPGTGLAALRRFCRAFPRAPVFALGGIAPARVAACLDAGAHGVAVLSGILHAGDPAGAARQYLEALANA